MKKLLIIIATFWLLLGLNFEASAWVNVANYGDTGWQTCTYTAGAAGFTGTVGFVVSNVKDTGAYSELLLDNLSQGGGENNRGFEDGLTGYTLTIDSTGESFGNVSESVTANSYTTYTPTEGSFFADLQGLSTGVDTSQFSNASGQAGTVGSILETAITLEPGAQFSFDWAFLANDKSPWNDFALFYLKDQSGTVVFSVGLAQIAAAPAAPIHAMVLLLGTCLFGLVSLSWRSKRPGGREL